MKNNYIFRVETNPFTKLFKLIDKDNNRIIEWEERDFKGTNTFGHIDMNFEPSFIDDEEKECFDNKVKKEMIEYIYENNLDTL